MPDKYTGMPNARTAAAAIARECAHRPCFDCPTPSGAVRRVAVLQDGGDGSIGCGRVAPRAWPPGRKAVAIGKHFRGMAIQIPAQQLSPIACAPAGRVGVPLADDFSSYSRVDRAFDKRRTRHAFMHAASASSVAVPKSGRALMTHGQNFTCGATSDFWSMSCKAPRPCNAVGRAADEEHGEAAICAFFKAVMVWSGPGPAVTAATPWCAGQARGGVGSEHGGGLIAHVDDGDAALLGSNQNRRNVPATEGENPFHAVGMPPGGCQQ